MSNTDLQTVADLARDFNVANGTAKNMLKGLTPSLTISNGRTALYGREAIKAHLAEKNKTLLAYLGHTLSPAQSYDSVVQVDDVVSE